MRAYSSNVAITDPVSLLIGDAIHGIVFANYGGSFKAQLGGWRRANAEDWRLFAPDTVIADEFGQLGDWAFDWALRLGGDAFAFFAPGGNRINCARICPPPDDPHVFIRIRRAKINEEDKGRPLTDSHFGVGAYFRNNIDQILV